MTRVGFEPMIPWLRGKHLNHKATAAIEKTVVIVKCFIRKVASKQCFRALFEIQIKIANNIVVKVLTYSFYIVMFDFSILIIKCDLMLLLLVKILLTDTQ